MTTHSDQHSTREERRKAGQALRDKVRRIDQGKFDPKARKFDAVELMKAAHKDRVPDLVPLKNARMAATPFTFFRGAAPLMAADWPRCRAPASTCRSAATRTCRILGAFGGGRRRPLDLRHQRFRRDHQGPVGVGREAHGHQPGAGGARREEFGAPVQGCRAGVRAPSTANRCDSSPSCRCWSWRATW